MAKSTDAFVVVVGQTNHTASARIEEIPLKPGSLGRPRFWCASSWRVTTTSQRASGDLEGRKAVRARCALRHLLDIPAAADRLSAIIEERILQVQGLPEPPVHPPEIRPSIKR